VKTYCTDPTGATAPTPGSRNGSALPARRRRTPRLAEAVADTLRERILGGELADGSELPNQERLLDEFGVSKQAVRDGLRILELEGLITVRRGNVGGAVVHLPTHSGAAYSLGLVLQSRGVRLAELGQALATMEPVCARLCAGRADRAETVVPLLKTIQEETTSVLEDVPRFMEAMSRFHTAIVSSCANQPIAVVVGAIEEVWLAQVKEWGVQQSQAGTFPDLAYRRAGVEVHEQMIELIAAGDQNGVATVAESHFDAEQFYTDRILPDQQVLVSLLQHSADDGLAVRPS
jgi:DNA-binding FadR family transcriptional regulator